MAGRTGFVCSGISIGLLLMFLGAPARAALVGPVNPYLSAADSPFNPADYASFYLEDFEDGLLNTPGVSASGGGVTSVVFGPSIHDSVDGDDGVIDGSGLQGDSFFSPNGFIGISFSFDLSILGVLPTAAGIVWTDGAGSATFEAFDSLGFSLGILSANNADGVVNGTTGEDTFFGVTNATGISRISIKNVSGGIEVDHLQYGVGTPGTGVVPIPAAAWLFGSALVGLAGFARRRRLQGC